MKNFLKKLASGVVLTTLLMTATAATPALAWNPFGQVCSGAGGKSAVCKDSSGTGAKDNPLTGPKGLITKITRIIAIIAGIAAVIVIIVSGLRMVTSGGDPKAAADARNGVIFASVGLVMIVLAQALISLIISRI